MIALLTNDRQIIISAAGSRKALHWPAQTLYWSELVMKLQTPARGTETLAEYLRLPKSKQDVASYIQGSWAFIKSPWIPVRLL